MCTWNDLAVITTIVNQSVRQARCEDVGAGRRWGSGGEIPGDLRVWLDPQSLRGVVEKEVARLDWRNPEVVGYLSRYPEYRPEAMLRLLVFAYAIQDFESEGIARNCWSDAGFQSLCDSKPVLAQDLIKFRRANRPLIEAVLGRVLRVAGTGDGALGRGETSSSGEDRFNKEARRRLDIARHFDTQD